MTDLTWHRYWEGISVTVADHRFGIDGGVGVKPLAEEDMRPVRPHECR